MGRGRVINPVLVRAQKLRKRKSVGYTWQAEGDREVIVHPKGSTFVSPVLKGSSKDRFLKLVARFGSNHPKVLKWRKKFGF